jgi:two-component system NtrC family response regulator
MNKHKKVLIVEDEQSFRQVMKFRLQEASYEVILAEDGLRGYELFTEMRPDIVVTDLSLPELNGLELTKRIKAISADIPIIVITAFGDIQTAVASMKLGVFDYLTKPLNWEEFFICLDRALQVKELVQENQKLRAFIGERFQLDNIIGTSKRMRETYDVVERVARTDISVLLLGESGTGKELIAKAIHHNSPRRDMPYVTINCGTIPEQLLESEFFGHRKGAFSGAIYDKRGLFEEAHNGTIFLDEIGELPFNLQVKLLRILQEGEFLRLGETSFRKVNVRVIAATNRDLSKMVENGTFREDLFFRLNIVPIKLPPLRERREDIPLLVKFFLDDAIKRYHRPGIRIAKDVYQCLHQYPWPGNVRELKNLIDRLVVLVHNDEISLEDIPEDVKKAKSSVANFLFTLPEGGIDLEDIEKEIIRQALEKNSWNQTHTAKYLNITRNTLIYRMQKFNLSQ